MSAKGLLRQILVTNRRVSDSTSGPGIGLVELENRSSVKNMGALCGNRASDFC